MMTYSRCLGVCRALSQEIFLHRTYPRPRYLHSSVILCKKRKSREERKNPQPIVYVAKSKFKKGTPVEVWHNMTIKDLAKTLDKDTDHVFEVMTFIDNTAKYRRDSDVINNFKIIEEVVKKSGHRCQIVPEPGEEVEKEFKDATRRNPSEYVDPRPRPPVVAIMGHVDHGKTTLLDTLRKSSIVDKEFGGITQHIGAFSVSIGKDKVTFLDTPGHAAFISMRSRGAHSTDIVVLVVAADDGVMEQTIESINMAKEANVPIIAAINKIDKPQADVERAKKMLMTYGILAEDYGGDVQMVPISALKGTNVDKLMEAILAQAEVMGLQSDYEGPVEGVIVESSTDTHRGKLGTVLVQCGTLKKGAVLVAGTTTCKVRAMFNDQGVPMASATPSTPVEILGWRDIPSAGDVLIEVSNEREATRIAHHRAQIEQEKKASESYTEIEKKAMEHYAKYREQLEIKRKAGRFKMKRSGPREKEIKDDDSGPRVNIVIKGDVDGSIEAILDVLGTYDNPKCRLDIVHYGVGPVSKNDFVLAESFNAIIYTFNTKLLEPAPDNVPVRNHNVIYRLVDDIKSEINERLPKLDVEELVGEANVLQEFLISEGKHKIPVAGCRCIKGSLKKSSRFKLVRGQEVIYDGQVSSLRHLKDEVDTIKKDLECGIRLADPSVRFNAGDTLVCYKINKVSDSIEWDPGF